MNSHRNAPLTPEGRIRLIERCRTRPIAHVAAEMGISRATASKWVNRYKQFGELGLADRSSAPARQPTATPGQLVERIEAMRREHKWSASRIAFELHQDGTPVSRRTITRLLAQLGLSHRKFIDPNGEKNREPQKIIAERPGHMVHIDVKKTGRIPTAAAGAYTARTVPKRKLSRRLRPAARRPGTSSSTQPSTDTPGSPTRKRWRTRRPSPRLRSSTAPGHGSQRTASPRSSGS